MRTAVPIVLAAALGALAAAPARAGGAPLTLHDAVTLFGPGFTAAPAGPDGTRTFTWVYRGWSLALRPTDPLPDARGAASLPPALPQLVAGECRLRLEVDTGGIVRGVDARGEACPSVLGDSRRWGGAFY